MVSDKVVALPGYTVPRTQGEPIAEVVELCQELLAAAQTGKLRALAVAQVLADPQLVTQTIMFSGPSPDRYCLCAAVSQLDFDIKTAMYGQGVFINRDDAS